MNLILLCLTTVTLIAVGLPWVMAIQRDRVRIEEFLFSAGSLGLAIALAAGIIALRLGQFNRVGLGLVLGLTTATGAVVAARTRQTVWPRVSWDHLSIVNVALLVPIAALVRSKPSYFIFQTGDMGEYVNSANLIAGGHDLTGGFPHGFTVLLGLMSTMLGESRAVLVVPAIGILFVLGIMAILRSLDLHPLAVAATASVAALHTVPVWFSVFPASEAPYAVLLLGSLSYLLLSSQSRRPVLGLVGGLMLGLTLLVRGNALVPLGLAIGVSFLAMVDESKRAPGVYQWFAGGLATTGAGAWLYNISYPREYFVERQLAEFLPSSTFRIAEQLGLFEPSPLLIALLIACIGAVLGALAALGHATRKRRGDRSYRAAWLMVLGAGLSGLAAAVGRVGADGLFDGLLRWGVPVLVLALIGLGSLFLGPRLPAPVSWLVLTVTIGAAGAALYAYRYREPEGHAYYLYWDRYLFSEAFPIALLLLGIGLSAVVRTKARNGRRASRRASIAIVLLATGIAIGPVLQNTATISRTPLFGDAYGFLQKVNHATDPASGLPIVYSGSPEPPQRWFFPNTYRAFALPLHQTFGRTVLGMPSNPFGRDPVFSSEEVEDMLAEADARGGYVVALHTSSFDGAAPFRADAQFKKVAEIAYVVPLISRATSWRAPAIFREVSLSLVVFRVALEAH